MNGGFPGSVERAPATLAGRSESADRWWRGAGGAWLGLATTSLLLLAAVHGPAVFASARLPAAAVATFAASRWVGARDRRLVPGTVLVGLAIFTGYGLVRGDLLDQLHGPLGYSNATAALYVIGLAAALMLREMTQHPVGRGALLALALLLLTVPASVYSRTGTVAALLVLGAAHPAWRRLDARATLVVGGALVSGIFVAMVLVVRRGGQLAALLGVDVATLPPSVTERVRLWAEALALVRGSPIAGSGPGAFGASTGHPRLDWEYFVHNEFLQVAVEGGAIALAVALTGIVLLAHRLLAGGDRVAVIGICLLTALCLHASVDYVARFPAVSLTAMAVLGAAATPSSRSNRTRRA